LHTGLTRHHVKSPITTSAELYHFYRTWDPHAAALTRHFSSSMEPLFIRGRGRVCAKKKDEECDEVHTGLTRHHVKSPVTTNAELYHIYRTCDPHAAALRRHSSSSMEPLFIRGRGRVCRQSGLRVRWSAHRPHPTLCLAPLLQRAQRSTKFIAHWTLTPLN
jgi:predicted metal-dependent HD superfamily phosphohydrolase